ncbi:hypothetical protein HAX54_023183, partial [Datura stramonium]|nr:hypothetical protein [Datura stramonium]
LTWSSERTREREEKMALSRQDIRPHVEGDHEDLEDPLLWISHTPSGRRGHPIVVLPHWVQRRGGW